MVFQLYDQLCDVLQPSQFQLLLVLLTRLRPLIERQLSHRDNPQRLLSSTVSEFLAHSLDVDRPVIDRSWEILRPHRESFGQDVDYQKLADDLFRLLGPQYDLGSSSSVPHGLRTIHFHSQRQKRSIHQLIDAFGNGVVSPVDP